MINLIWAMDENRLIGIGDKIPWHVKEDLLYYKEKTKGKSVLMGEVTYYSLKKYYKNAKLPYKKIYVASFNKNLVIDEAIIINDLDEFLKQCQEEIFVVGGLSIYKIALKYADYLYISEIKGTYNGDVYFPEFSLNDYALINRKDSLEVSYFIYKRNKVNL